MEVFCTSPWVPPEWIKAHGLEPRGIWLARDFACEPLPLAAGVCAFANAAVRLAERQSRVRRDLHHPLRSTAAGL